MKLESSKLELSEQMIKTCLEMETRDINQGTSGNLSMRFNNGFLILSINSLCVDLQEVLLI